MNTEDEIITVPEEATYKYCNHGKAIWSDQETNDDREHCTSCVIEELHSELSKLREWQEEATRLLKLMLTRSPWKGERDFIERLLNEAKESK